jgi:hypothetical protein
MKRRKMKTKTTLKRQQRRGRACLLFVVLLLPSCAGNEEGGDDILVAANPPSMDKGQSVSIELRSTGKLFTEAVTAPIESDGGLVMKTLKPRDAKRALATFVSDKETEVGIHTFELKFGSREAALSVSVLAPDSGPGTVTAEGNVASSGAEFAYFVINGEGTQFDSRCEVKAEGADGFRVRFIAVEGPRRIKVYYEIALEQEPGDATIVLTDGDYRYDLPFTIVGPSQLDNAIEGQVVEKGRRGEVLLYHPAATLLSSTRFDDDEADLIETGEAVQEEEGDIAIPIRVPYDFAEDTLDMTARTYLERGAILEMVSTEVTLVEPAYLAIKGAKLDHTPGSQRLAFTVQGIDAREIEQLIIEEGAGAVFVVGWEVDSEDSGFVDIYQSEEVVEGPYKLVAETPTREISAVLAVSNRESQRAHVPDSSIFAGDHLFVPVTVEGRDLFDGAVEAVSDDEDLAVVRLTRIDDDSVILELAIDENTYPGTRRLTLEGQEYSYSVSIQVEESGF